jgi:agmatine deiminase
MSKTLFEGPTPRQLGYFFPPEWANHASTWLSWIQKEESWPGKLEDAYPAYCEFISRLSFHEQVNINVSGPEMEADAKRRLKDLDANRNNIRFHYFETNDAWCRDHGPAFLLHKSEPGKRAVIDWGYNAWGGKYPPFDLDDVIPTKIGGLYGLPVFEPGIVMEGGSVEFNGAGTLLTTTACLLNENRNPHLNQEQIEWYLREFYGVEQILWLDEGIVGDDTDGHIDDITRFVKPDTVLTVVEKDPKDENYEILQENLKKLKSFRLLNGKALNIVEIPMPAPVIWEDQRLPASYANFYIGNGAVYVPVFRDPVNDPVALQTIQKCFPDRRIYGIDSTDLIWGLGSFHCLSQQEPAF